uniref:Uncharacterized protein n=1 Tax=Anguilla anguilla TaxID=7936 RepID=A0A0E9U2I1_ANGAN
MFFDMLIFCFRNPPKRV